MRAGDVPCAVGLMAEQQANTVVIGGHNEEACVGLHPSLQNLAHFVAGLARLSALHAEMAQVCAELGEIQLDESTQSSLMDCPDELDVSGHVRTDLMNVRDVAKRMGVSPRTIRRWRGAGALPPCVHLGSVVRWRPADIEAWLVERGEQ